MMERADVLWQARKAYRDSSLSLMTGYAENVLDRSPRPRRNLEKRSIAKSTIFTTQRPLDHWLEIIADSIRDRRQHSASTINLAGESYSGVKARKYANKKKGCVRIVTR